MLALHSMLCLLPRPRVLKVLASPFIFYFIFSRTSPNLTDTAKCVETVSRLDSTGDVRKKKGEQTAALPSFVL